MATLGFPLLAGLLALRDSGTTRYTRHRKNERHVLVAHNIRRRLLAVVIHRANIEQLKEVIE